MSIETTVIDPGHRNDTWTIRRTKVYAAGYEMIDNDCPPPLRERTSG